MTNRAMNKKAIITAMLALVAFFLASCSSDDDNEDKVEQVTVYVSAETGTYQNVPDNNSVEGMLIREEWCSQLEVRQLHGNHRLHL